MYNVLTSCIKKMSSAELRSVVVMYMRITFHTDAFNLPVFRFKNTQYIDALYEREG